MVRFCASILAVSLITIADGQTRRRTPTARLVARRALSSLVLLVSEDSTEKRRFGSGFFVADDLVVTNYHVVRGNFTTEIRVKLVGQAAVHDLLDTISSIVAFNEKADLCILRVRAERGRRLDLAPNSQVAIGDEVYVAGNPEGLEGTLSQGIVSGIRQFNGIRYVQITAPVSAGSSGGPVLNRYGQVIAVATATLDMGQNLNFAIPVSYLSPLVAEGLRTPKNRSVARLADLPADDKEYEAWGYLSQARTLYHQKRYNEALDVLEKTTNLKPDYGDAHYYTALVLRDLGNYQEAIIAAKKAVKVNPKDCANHYLLGRLYLLVGERESTRRVSAQLDSLGCRDLSDELFRAIR